LTGGDWLERLDACGMSVSAVYATLSGALLPVLAAVAARGMTAWGFSPPQQARFIGIAGLMAAAANHW
jgi:hypothetical protein